MIYEVNRRSLEELPDVESVAVGVDGIVVDTANPDALPLSIEGVPIIPAPSFGRPIKEIPYAEVPVGSVYARQKKELRRLPGTDE